MNRLLRRIAMLSVLIGAMMGCGSLAEINNVATVPLDFAEVKANPDAHRGFDVRWGGVIARVINQNDKSLVEIVEYPLGLFKSPSKTRASRGRFMVRFNQFIEPTVYSEGRSITVVGRIEGKYKGRLGEGSYDYPLLEAVSHHLWAEERREREVIILPTHPHYPYRYYVPRDKR